MKLGPAAVGIVGAALLLSGCAQQSGTAAAASGATGEPGVVTYVSSMRATDFVVPENISKHASDERKASEAAKYDGRLVLVGNGICQVAAEAGVSYGSLVQEVVVSADDPGGTGAFVVQEKSADGSAVSAAYDDTRVFLTKPMDYRMAEFVVQSAVTNLCPPLTGMLPGATPTP